MSCTPVEDIRNRYHVGDRCHVEDIRNRYHVHLLRTYVRGDTIDVGD